MGKKGDKKIRMEAQKVEYGCHSDTMECIGPVQGTYKSDIFY
jgi:hypothetical protein